jgi:hypothetical protein
MSSFMKGGKGTGPNGIKLSRNLLFQQGLMQLRSWFCPEWILLGSGFPHSGLGAVRTIGMDHPLRPGDPRTGRAPPTPPIDEPDPSPGDPLATRGLPHHHADPIRHPRQPPEFLAHSRDRLATQDLPLPGSLPMVPMPLDLPTLPRPCRPLLPRLPVGIPPRSHPRHRTHPEPRPSRALPPFPDDPLRGPRCVGLGPDPLGTRRGREPGDHRIGPAPAAPPPRPGQPPRGVLRPRSGRGSMRRDFDERTLRDAEDPGRPAGHPQRPRCQRAETASAHQPLAGAELGRERRHAGPVVGPPRGRPDLREPPRADGEPGPERGPGEAAAGLRDVGRAQGLWEFGRFGPGDARALGQEHPVAQPFPGVGARRPAPGSAAAEPLREAGPGPAAAGLAGGRAGDGAAADGDARREGRLAVEALGQDPGDEGARVEETAPPGVRDLVAGVADLGSIAWWGRSLREPAAAANDPMRQGVLLFDGLRNHGQRAFVKERAM